MKRQTVLALLAFAVIQSNHLGATTLVFNEPDFEWLATGGDSTPYHIWTAGDFWAQAFQATDLTTANEISLSLLFNSLSIGGPDLLSLGVLLNGVEISDFSVPAGMRGRETFMFSFTPVAGPSYRIEIRANNTIPLGNGSVSIALGGSSFATVVPEPSAASLLICVAAVGLAFRFHRKKQPLQ